MISIDKRKIINCVKLITFIFLAYMLINVFVLFNPYILDNKIHSSSLKEINFKLNFSTNKNFIKSFLSTLNVCNIQSFDHKNIFEVYLNKIFYYSIGIFLGFYLNTKKLVKSAVI